MKNNSSLRRYGGISYKVMAIADIRPYYIGFNVINKDLWAKVVIIFCSAKCLLKNFLSMKK